MQIRKRIKTAQPTNDFEKVLEQELHSAWLELSTLINGGLKFGDNFSCAIKNVSNTGLGGTEITIAHGLKRIPIGYVLIRTDGITSLYDSTTPWTIDNIYIKNYFDNNNITVLIF